MYCFSIIDLLGSLYAGNARSGNTRDNSAIRKILPKINCVYYRKYTGIK
jgi:hypothetical protein